MGIVYSKLQQYINTKIENVKQSIRNRIEAVKQGIKNKINNTRDAFNNKVNQVITSCKNCIRSTKEDIIGAAVNVKDRICGRIERTRNYICDICFMIKSNILGKINFVRNSVISVRDRITNTICRGRDNVVQKYVNVVQKCDDVKSDIKNKYRAIRHAKLTKRQKAYYSVLGFIIACMLYVVMATSFDLYTNDYDQIEARFTSIWEGTKVVARFSFDISSMLMLHAWQLTCVACSYLWHFSVIAWTHTSEGLSILKQHLHEWSKEAVLLVGRSAKEALLFLWWCIEQIANYVAIGMMVSGKYAWQGGLIAADHLKCSAAVGLRYAHEGSTTALRLAKDGSTRAYCWSSETFWEYGPQIVDYLVYFTTDFRHASVEAFGLTVEFIRSAFFWTCSALCNVLQVSYDLLVNSLLISYNSLFDFVQWTYDQSLACAEASYYYSGYALRQGYQFSIDSYASIENFVILSHESIVKGSIVLYDGSLRTYERLANWLVASAEAACSWGVYLYSILYVFATEHGLVWLSKICSLLLEALSILLVILLKFFGDLGTFVFKFVSVTSDRIYTVTYFLVSFGYAIVTFVVGTVKLILSCLVYCMTGLFGATIWSCAFLGKSYLAFLNYYNGYREMIFFSFLTLLSVYCAGVAKDRNESHRMISAKLESIRAVRKSREAFDELDSNVGGRFLLMFTKLRLLGFPV